VTDYQHPPVIRRIWESLVPVICPPEAVELGLGADIVDHVGLTMGALPDRFRQGLTLGLYTYDLGALAFLPGRGTRAHKLAPALAEQYFVSWLTGPTPVHRQLAIALKQLLSLAHYEQPAVQEQMGYRPTEWIEKVKKRRLDVYADEVDRHQQSLIAPDPLPGVGRWPRRARKGVA
jgi:hypothetical protein